MMQTLILASASARRREILENLGVKFTCCPADIDENIDAFPHNPAGAVECLAREKAAAVPDTDSDSLILAADTVVCLGEEILGKPKDKEDAKQMLTALSNTTHAVYTGIAVRRGEKCIIDHVKTLVTFRTLSEGEIDAYIASGEPMDKAGAYGIQGLGALFVEKIEGDYFNVVGLPVCRLFEILSLEFGYTIL